MGIKLDNKTPRDFGLIFLTEHYHPLTPDMRTNTLVIPGMNGEWDFGSEWGTRSFTLPFGMVEHDIYERQRKLSEFVAFLCDAYGRPRTIKLTFDYEPDKYYEVKLAVKIDPTRLRHAARFDVQLIAHNPEKKFIVPSSQISWDSDIPFMNDVLWGMDETEFTINKPQTITLVYSGTAAIRAGFILRGSGTDVKVSANGKTMTFGNMRETTYEVDGQSYSIKKNGEDSLVSTQFIELVHGENQVTISGSYLNLTFSEQLTYQFI